MSGAMPTLSGHLHHAPRCPSHLVATIDAAAMNALEVGVVTVEETWAKEGLGAKGAKQGATSSLEISAIIVRGERKESR